MKLAAFFKRVTSFPYLNRGVGVFLVFVFSCFFVSFSQAQAQTQAQSKGVKSISKSGTNLDLDSDVVKQEIIIQVEEYIGNTYFRNGYWDSLQNHFQTNPQLKEYFNAKLYEVFRPGQKQLFKDCLNGGDVLKLIKEHESNSKFKLDSVLKFYTKNPNKLLPRVRLPFEQERPAPPPIAHCENMDMEECNFNNWELATGKVNDVAYGFSNRVVTSLFNTGIPIDDGLQHGIVSTPATDPITGIQVINPGGTCSAVLGDRLGDGYNAASMRRQFLVTNENYFFSYSYAVIMEDPTNVHTAGERPYFTVRMFDESGGSLNCANYEVYSGDGNPAWLSRSSLTGSYSPIAYTDWTQAFIPLQAYIGQNVTIEFSVGDCNLGGHAAYAYVEATCGGFIEVEDTLICPGIPMEMIAPGGASSYLWNTGETTRSIMVNDSGIYTVTMGSTADNSCTSSLSKRMYLKKAPIGDFKADTVCVNTPTTFIDLSSAATTKLTSWEWDFESDNVFDKTGQSVTNVFTVSGNHSVTLQVEDSNQCKHDTSFIVNVLANPVVDFTHNNPCFGDSTILTNTSTNYITTQWDLFNNGTTLSSLTDEKRLYTLQQDVELKVTSIEGCSDSLVKTIVINPLPVASFTNTEVCFPLANSFTDASSIASGAIVSWFWDFGDSTGTSISENPTYSYASKGVYDVKHIVVSDSSCRDTIVKQVKFFEKPVVDFIVNDTCQNEAFNMVNTSTLTSSTFVTWNWDVQNDGVTNYLSKDASHILTDAGVDSIKLIGVTAEGCRDTIVKAVHIDTLPVANFVSLPVCLNNSSVFNDLSEGDISKWTWDYLNDASVDATIQNPTTIFIADGVFDVKLKVETTKGCLDSITKSIIINPLPVADFSSADVCEPAITVFENNSTISTGNIAIYEWKFGDGVGVSTSQDPTYQYSLYDEYDVELIAISDSSCRDTLVKQFSYFEKPIVDFSVNDTCRNKVFSMQNLSVVGSSTFTDWKWDVKKNGVIDYTTQDATHALTVAGLDSIALYGTTAQGCKDTVVKAITIHPLPTSFFTFNEVCLNDSSVFDNKASGIIALSEWDFDNNGSVESTLTDPKFKFLTTGLHNVELKVTSDKGCLDSLALNAKVNYLPDADFEVPQVCFPESSPFTNLSTIQEGSIVTNVWDFGDGIGTSSAVNPIYTYLQSGSQSAKLKIISNKGCVDSISKVVVVNEKPNADFVFRDTCVFDVVSFSNQSTVISSSINQWKWDVLNNGVVDYSTQNPTHVFNNSGNFDIELIVTTSESCSDTVLKSIQIFNQPIAAFNFQDDCLGKEMSFTDQSTSIDGTVTAWIWNQGDGTDYTTQNTTHTYASEQKYQVRLEVNTDKNCKDTIIHEVAVFPTPIPDFSTDLVCIGFSSPFNSESTVSNLHTSNTIALTNWNFGDNSARVTGDQVSHLYSTDGTYLTKMIITTDKGCQDSIEKVVTVAPNPIVNMTSTLREGCSEWCVDFQDATFMTDGGTVVAYSWDFENATSSDKNPSNCFSNYTQDLKFFDVSLTATSNNGCIATMTKEDWITVFPLSYADFNYSPDFVTDQNGRVDFNNESIGTNWIWSFGDGGTDSIFSPSYLYKEAGEYTISLVANNSYNCPDSISKLIEVKPTYAFYAPNAITADGDGMNDVFYIYGHNIIDFKLHIFDRWGLRLFTSNDMNVGWDGTYRGDYCQQDVYIYKAYLTDIFNKEHTLVGTVTLIR